MALPELTLKLVETSLAAYCHNKIPTHARAQVRLSYKVWSNSVTLNEERAVYDSPGKWTTQPIAQFRFDVVDSHWRLYCANFKRKSGWLLYPDLEPSRHFASLLRVLDTDTLGVFWG
jgi:hypothetical protein